VNNPLRASEILVRPPLSREEECALLEVIAVGRKARTQLKEEQNISIARRGELQRRSRSGRAAEQKVLESTMGLVKHQVATLGFPFDSDELELAGIEGLVTALHRFDPSKGSRFSTYAYHWIRKLVFASISKRYVYSDSDIRLVIEVRKLAAKSNGRDLTKAEVVRKLGWTRAQASRILQISDDMRSGTAPLSESLVSNDSGEFSLVPEAEWVIATLKGVLGDDFRDFWLRTGGDSLEELGAARGISKQAMAKRLAKARAKVESSPDAVSLLKLLRSF